jgi:hypothetical protein
MFRYQPTTREIWRPLFPAIRYLTILTAAVLLGGCSGIVRSATAKHQPLSYIGEVSFGTPAVEGRTVTIPVSFSGGEWAQNSAIVLYRIRSRLSGQEIEMTVTTSVASGNVSRPQLVLPKVYPGEYSVFYRDPNGTRHQLSGIIVPPSLRMGDTGPIPAVISQSPSPPSGAGSY